MSQGFDPAAKSLHGEAPLLRGARILAALEAVKTAAIRALTNQKAASSLVLRQHGELEAVQEAGQKLNARGRDLRNSLQLLRESLDRAKLVALNAGLEGRGWASPWAKRWSSWATKCATCSRAPSMRWKSTPRCSPKSIAIAIAA